MTPTTPTPTSPRGRRHLVVAVVYDGLGTFEFGVASELFGLKRPEFPDWYDFAVASCGPSLAVRATGGVTVEAHGDLSLLAGADTVIVPGWCGVDTPPSKSLLDALRRSATRGARLVSFCSGAFVLAATGLLDGRAATTHWLYAPALRERFPRLHVDEHVLYVEADNIYTSAGSAAALDLGLHLIRKDRGAQVANRVAQRLVTQPHRAGGQAQFLRPTEPDAGGGRLQGALAWAHAHLAEPHSVASLAARAGMSPRNFARRVLSAYGTTPGRWLVQQRIIAAQALLERSDESLEAVAAATGFGCVASFRSHFTKTLGVTPAAYRRTWQRAAE